MNMFDAASKARQAVLPSLPKGSVRKTAAALFGLIGPTTPVHGKMFNPEKYVDKSPRTGAIVRVLQEIPISNFTQWTG